MAYVVINEKAAYNHSTSNTFAATCRKNGVSTHVAAINTAKDMRRSMFNSGIPQPTALGAGPEDGGE